MAVEKSAGAVVYRVATDGTVLYLLLQASPGKPWGFPKGKIDTGESEEESARREIAEEAGLDSLDIDADFRHVVHYTYRRGRSLVRKEVVYFLTRAHTENIRISWEHVAYRWATLNEALELVVFESARVALRKAYAHLQQHLPIE
ncbi:MAG: bis(5'-nucleosyl)-tetraphosphatase [Armatimonadota bacterium]